MVNVYSQVPLIDLTIDFFAAVDRRDARTENGVGNQETRLVNAELVFTRRSGDNAVRATTPSSSMTDVSSLDGAQRRPGSFSLGPFTNKGPSGNSICCDSHRTIL